MKRALFIFLMGCTMFGTACGNKETKKETAHETSEAVAVNPDFDDEDIYTDWKDGSVCNIALKDTSVSIDGSGANMQGNTILIEKGGTYILEGTYTAGPIVVDASQESEVRLVLNNVTLNTKESAAIYCVNGKKVIISMPEGTDNTITDGTTVRKIGEEEGDAAVYAKTDLSFNGTGKLSVTGNYDNGIKTKDDLKITGGTFVVKAKNNGILGKDMVAVSDGTFTVTSDGDGITATNEEDADKGFIWLEKGTYTIKSSTAKGIKAPKVIEIQDGTYDVECEDDAIHCNGNITIHNGKFTLSSRDDGVHADGSLVILDGNINVKESYEGLEGAKVTIDGGEHEVYASDDGINTAGGSDSSSEDTFHKRDMFSNNSDNVLTINGGKLYVNSEGDGLDSNGSIYIYGGEAVVDGPQNGGNGALDYNGECVVEDGKLVAAGSSGMMLTISDTSSVYALAVVTKSTQSPGTKITIKDSEGKEVFTCNPAKSFNSVVIVDKSIKKDTEYTAYAGNTKIATAKVSQIVTDLYEEGANVKGNMGGGKGGFGRKKMQDGERPDDERQNGGKPNGEMPNGEMPNGKMPDGEMPDGTPPADRGNAV